jgi:hypothetical protein
MYVEMSSLVEQAPISRPRRTAHPGATVRVQTHHATFFAVFGARPGSMLGETAARVALETLHQELSVLDGRRPIQSELTEVVSRLDLALRLTHPGGGPLARGCVSIVCLTRDELLLTATRTGSMVIVEGTRDVVLATPNAPGRISTAVGGPLDELEEPIRLGWARLPALRQNQRLVVATRDLSVLFNPNELVDCVSAGPIDSVAGRLEAVAAHRGEGNVQLAVTDLHEDLTDACLTQVHTAFRTDDVRLRTPPPAALSGTDIVDPVATHHGQVSVMVGRLDRWLARNGSESRARPPGLALLGPAGWQDLKKLHTRTHAPGTRPSSFRSGASQPESGTKPQAWAHGLLAGLALLVASIVIALLVA